LKPDDFASQFALAEVLVQAKQPGKAREVLKKLIKRSPNYPRADALLRSVK
jgi:hypothetical protein